MNKKKENLKEFGLKYIWVKRKFRNKVTKDIDKYSILIFILPFTKTNKCQVTFFWEPIIHSIFTFVIFFIFFYYNILFFSFDFLLKYSELKLYLLLFFLFLFLFFFFYFYKEILKDKKGWYDYILKIFIIYINIVLNLLIICYFFDINLVSFIQYTIVFHLYRLYGLLVFFINKILYINIPYYNIKSFIYYPYFFTLFIMLLVIMGFDYKIPKFNLLFFLDIYFLNYQGFLNIRFFKKGSIVLMGDGDILIKWKTML